MARLIYITFDPYYEADEYNDFLTAASNNGIEYNEFISVKPPYLWYVQLDIDDAPRFVNYDLLSSSAEKFIVNKMRPRNPNEAYQLLRRNTDNSKDIERFVSPKPFIEAKKQDYVCFFKAFNKNELLKLSTALGNSKIWKVAKTKHKGTIYMTFNPYIKGLIPQDYIFFEKTNKGEFNKVGQLEYELNHKHLVTEKLDGKGMELEYFQNGKYHPLREIKFL